MAPRIVIVGGGITGLAAAYEIGRRDPTAEVVLLEASDRLGGKILTTPFAGLDVDAGPDAFLARVPWAVELCRELGLDRDLVSPAVRRAYIWSRGRLRALPEASVLGVPVDLDQLASSGLVSPAGILRARRDLADSPHPRLRATRSADPAPEGDVSVGALVRSRLGDEVLEQIVDPLLGGINAGDADRLSVEASAPQLASAAARDASLIRGLLAERDEHPADPSAPVFFTLPDGLGRLVTRLAGAISAEVRVNTRVHSIERSSSGFEVVTERGRVDADAVVVTTPAAVAAEQVARLSAPAAELLAGVDYASVVLVSLDVPLARTGRALDASGFLVPRTEGLLLTACSWASAKWEHLAGRGRAILRASAGRYGDDRAMGMDDDELVTQLLADLGTTMGLDAEPSEVRVNRWPSSFPQYLPGHLQRAAAIEQHLAEDAPGVLVAGAAMRGVGIPACIRQGREAAVLASGARVERR